VMKYERLELEDFPPKQKLRMLQNAVGDVTELAYVKHIGDQNIAQGNPTLTYEGSERFVHVSGFPITYCYSTDIDSYTQG
jgi:hypothetical protein